MIIQTRSEYFLIREKAEDEMHVRKKKRRYGYRFDRNFKPWSRVTGQV